MPTLKAIRREMMRRVPAHESIGRVEDIASLTTTTVVVNALATGTVNPEKFIRKWLLRAEGAAADRVRMSSNFSSSTGTLTHAGANYSDTTATNEKIEIHEHEPYIVDQAINVELGRLMRIDREIIPATAGHWYYLDDLDWIHEPGDVQKVAWSAYNGLCRNADLQKYNTISSTGAMQPDAWTLAGSGATMARSTTQTYRAPYSLAITRAGTDCTVSQKVGLLVTGVDGDELANSKTVTAFARVWASAASTVRVQLYDEVNASIIASSSYHSGGSDWEELATAETALSTSIDGLTVQVSVETNDGTVYVARLDAVRGGLTDAVRRGNFEEYEVDPRPYFDQGSGPLRMYLDGRSNGQYVVYSYRPYPEFNADRMLAGTADADETDAPIVTIATGAIARLFETVHGAGDPRAREWRGKADTLYRRHRYERSEGTMAGLNVPQRSIEWGVR